MNDETKVEEMRRRLNEVIDAMKYGDYERVNILLDDFEYVESDDDDGIGTIKLREK